MFFSFGFSLGFQEDPVLLTPEDNTTKPYVAIIKVICLPFVLLNRLYKLSNTFYSMNY